MLADLKAEAVDERSRRRIPRERGGDVFAGHTVLVQ
jgi:hypothetical protein